MTELALAWLPVRRFYRSLYHLSDLSWITTLAFGLGGGVVAFGLWRLGNTSAQAPINLIGASLAISYLVGFWASYTQSSKIQPGAWRLISRGSWLYLQTARRLLPIMSIQLLLIISYYVGLSWALGTSWWQALLLSLGLALASLGVSLLGSAVGSFIRLIARHYLIRSTLVILALYGFWVVASQLTPVSLAFHLAWQLSSFNSSVLAVLCSLGLVGVGFALTELLLPRHYPNHAQPHQYWQLKLPTKGLGDFGAGTAVYISELIRYLRDASFQRTVTAGVMTLAVGLLTLNIFTNYYSASAEVLFYGLVAAVSGFLASLIGFKAGQKAEESGDRYRSFPVSPSKLTAAYFTASLTVTLAVTAIIAELFIVQIISWPQIALVVLLAMTAQFTSFLFGRVAAAHPQNNTDPMASQSFSLLTLTFVIGASLLLISFWGVVSPVVTALVLIGWGSAAGLFAKLGQRRR